MLNKKKILIIIVMILFGLISISYFVISYEPPIEETPQLNSGQWLSPSDWVYVRENKNIIETVYGNFNYSSDGITMYKNNVYMGTLRIGKADDLSVKSPLYITICNENDKECNLTIDYNDEKIFVNFNKISAKISYEYINTKLSSELSSFYLELETDSKPTISNENYTLFDNEMSFSYSEINENIGVDKVEFKDNKLRVDTKPVSINPDGKVEVMF